MLGRDCGIPDERWVDYHLGQLGAASLEALDRHAESCSACRSACLRWAELLGVSTERRNVARKASASDKAMRGVDWDPTDANAMANTDQGFARDEELPSAQVYRSLRRRMAMRSLFRKANRRPGRAAASVIAALLAVVLIGLFKYSTAPNEPAAAAPLAAQHYAQLHEPEGARLMELPGTRVIMSPDIAEWTASASSGRPRQSLTVWVNDDTEELFVLMEGVLESDTSDVQAWADSRSRLSNLGLLEFHSGQGHLYSRFREMAALESLRFTIEPKGGSELPTTPDSALVRLASE